jgi:aryl-alcohol dehydrogenase-like predicted oxidoreductase
VDKRILGNSNVSVSVIGLGTWPMGGGWWGKTDDNESVHTIHRALELGVTLFDSAEGYAKGHSEKVLGRGLKGYRDKAVISTKVSPSHLDKKSIRKAFADSCRRLHSDYIDIYFVHWPNIDAPIGETMETMEKMREEGKIRAIGVSNFTADEMEEASKYGRIDVLQPPYSLFWRFGEAEDFPYCREHDIGIMTYSSLAQGLLTGTISRETKFADNDRRPSTVLFKPEHFIPCLNVVEQLGPIAVKYGKTPAQIALAWLFSQPGVSTALVGARTVPEIEEDVGGYGWDLAKEDIATIDKLGRSVTDTTPSYPDMFCNWELWELQKRRYEQQNRLPE